MRASRSAASWFTDGPGAVNGLRPRKVARVPEEIGNYSRSCPMRYTLILIFLLCRILLTLANPVQHGTYAAIYYTNEFIVAAIDSRTTDSANNVISDSVC